MGFKRTGELQESLQDFSAVGSGQASHGRNRPMTEMVRLSCFTVFVWFLQCFVKVSVKSSIAPLKVVLGGAAGRLAEVV